MKIFKDLFADEGPAEITKNDLATVVKQILIWKFTRYEMSFADALELHEDGSGIKLNLFIFIFC